MKSRLTKFSRFGLISGVLMICLFIFALFYFQQPESSAEESTVTQQDGFQVVTINVKDDGFYPNNIEIQAGVPTKLNFKKLSRLTCIKSVASPELGMDVYLEKGDNFFTLKDLKPGTYKFHCGMYMYYGTITVR
ncbi:cupredoxin domain-containing protein [Paenibacillus chondroitinus]|uniref:Cupredoxin domain-containing protein n=1 Tax=Paenibacillus chondroitinus TaxID=59842 RepID=A0ABU6DEU0_9BACL|nr:MULTISPECIES: cupredoxin domain-containing protein [Paenibacillus]MCY9662381.1 cupredoxin domain-containing protein [Paenibacillus anseongense]MEB4795832.1 cupredoxin domain-containing protein [Paenibacillus chondroitinus]